MALAVAALAGVVGLSKSARAAAIMVNTTADDDGTGSTCSLREAIKAANTDAAYGGCTAGHGADYIWFSTPSASATVPLTRDESLLITSNLTIDGGTNVVIRGTATSQGIVVQSATAALVRLRMTGFGRNAPLTVSGSVHLEESEISDNVAVGAAPPTLGIWVKATGSLFATDVTLRNNSAALGGAVYNAGGNVTLVNVTVADNESSRFGGGIANVDGGNMAIRNSTIMGNIARGSRGGGVYTGDGSTTNIDASTIVNNRASLGAGIYVSQAGHAVVSIRDTVVADNFADEDSATNGCLGRVFSYSGNTIGPVDGCDLLRIAGARGPADAVGRRLPPARSQASGHFVPVVYMQERSSGREIRVVER